MDFLPICLYFYLTSCFLLANFVLQTSSEAKQCRLPSNPTSATCTPITTPPPLATPVPTPTPVSTPTPTRLPTPTPLPPCPCPPAPPGCPYIGGFESIPGRAGVCSSVSCTVYTCPPSPPPTPTPEPPPPLCSYVIDQAHIDPPTTTNTFAGRGGVSSPLGCANAVKDRCMAQMETLLQQDIAAGRGIIDSTYLAQLSGGNFVDCMKSALGGLGQFVDANCQPIQNTGRTCGRIIIQYTPLSLIWSEDNNYLQSTFTKFPISPNSINQWFSWQASGSKPLIVFDPEHKGVISSGKQLFGNFTFGKSWENGYEALASLDIDHSNAIEKKELNDLALWFDYNQDGISQKGEVQDIKSVGIVSLYFQPDFSDIVSKDIHANIGYKKLVNRRIITGSSVDWYVEGPYDNLEQANVHTRVIPML